MSSKPGLSYWGRLALAFSAFWRTLADAGFAMQVARLQSGASLLAAESGAGKTALLRDTAPESALQLLGLLQQEGRFVDFLEENVSNFSDAQIGGAARLVHEGCRRALREHLSIEPVRPENEGMRLTLEAGFDAATIRLTGHVVGSPPFSGTLVHRGWRVTQVHLPKLADGHDVRIVAPAEVEL